jgi:hypothetical protein
MSTSLKEPAAKVFVARKAHTIALRENLRNPTEHDQVQRALGNHPETVIGQATINLYSQVWKSPEDSLPKLYCVT